MGRGDVDGARDGSCVKLNMSHVTRCTPHVTIHTSSLGFDFKLRCYFSADIGDSSLEGEHTSTQKTKKKKQERRLEVEPAARVLDALVIPAKGEGGGREVLE